MTKEPIFDTAQLAHAELYTPKLEKSVEFFTKLLGMTVVHLEGKSVYLRAYEDSYIYSLILTENDEPGLAHVSWRATSENALYRRVEAIEKTGLGKGWKEESYGHGRAYQFRTPNGHNMEIFWEVERYQAPAGQESVLLNRPQRRPLSGVPVRRIDHINLLTADVEENKDFMVDNLGFNVREGLIDDEGIYHASWLSVSPIVHEIALMEDELGNGNRLHHLAFWYGLPENLNDLSDLCVEYGVPIEAGPLKQGVSQALCMYIIEPGGNRIELFGDSGYLIFEPDWEPRRWTGDLKEQAIIWYGGKLPVTYFRYGTPVINDPIEEANVYFNTPDNLLCDFKFSEFGKPYGVDKVTK
ncbi:catechol 2,3-dioxygenase [Oceanobacillus arenosus]|uniref:Catechol 2,3-dioxygenase n=1 Tax=Oceanobacillus arenosus TaxID=1229153 RepID=A0A3D8PTW3_9BACI|nr:VOC family protein [Oceanobacillus arenosus]RDW19434.1 catechol 2,3-dioxygenase [Oceanobacillus arenosus]